MISNLHVRIHQSNCTLSSLTENEMVWKHHWAWHASSGASAGGGGSDKPLTAFEKRLQGQIDRISNQASWSGSGRGRRGNKQNGGQQKGSNQSFNRTGIPPPPGNGKGGQQQKQKGGQQPGGFAKRQRKGGKQGK